MYSTIYVYNMHTLINVSIYIIPIIIYNNLNIIYRCKEGY